jgi:ubiquitin-protein ligase E3 B
LFLQHFEGDVDDLGLTFSLDEDIMGRVETHELVPVPFGDTIDK